MIARLVAAALVLGCAGCAAPAWRNMDPAHDTRTAFRWDEQRCRESNQYRDAHPHWGENPLFPWLVVDEEAAARCLERLGWRRLESGPVTRP